MYFGEVLTQLRKMRGWERTHLAAKTGLETQTIRKLELGERTDPHCSTLAKLSDALGVSADDMLLDAGLKKRRSDNPTTFSANEKEIIKCIRAIESPAFRQHVLETILMFAKGAQEADHSYDK